MGMQEKEEIGGTEIRKVAPKMTRESGREG